MTGKNIRVLGPYRRKLALQVLYGKAFGAGTNQLSVGDLGLGTSMLTRKMRPEDSVSYRKLDPANALWT